MKNKIKKAKVAMRTVILTSITYLIIGTNIYAAGEPKIVSGTKSLVADATLWLTGLIAGVTVIMALFKGYKWLTAEEEEKKRASKGVTNTLIIGVVLTCISGLVTVILGYYA